MLAKVLALLQLLESSRRLWRWVRRMSDPGKQSDQSEALVKGAVSYVLTLGPLRGYKTYICAAALAGVTVALYLGYINQQTATMLYGLFGAGTAMALRAGVAKGPKGS